jgi:HAD superfamily hydrolase (TIGR01549 family)
LGVLSNTCQSHWEHCRRKFCILRESFSVYALSYEIHEMKPDAAIFQAAAELAGVAPEQIFFTDDMAGHVAGARAAGVDAVQYVSTPQLAAELRSRGVRVNY